MTNPTQALKELERKFWQSMVDNDAETAVDMLTEPALMVSPEGSMKFDHATYRRMAEQGSMVLTSFELSDMDVTFPTETTAIVTYRVKQSMSPRGKRGSLVQEMNDSSTWIRTGDRWQCAMHTETPAKTDGAKH